MNQKKFNVIAKTNKELETELAFYIATSRAEGAEIIKISVPDESKRFLSAAERILRTFKKAGKVQLFEMAEKLSSDSAAAWYLRNKYPQHVAEWEAEKLSLIVKI